MGTWGTLNQGCFLAWQLSIVPASVLKFPFFFFIFYGFLIYGLASDFLCSRG